MNPYMVNAMEAIVMRLAFKTAVSPGKSGNCDGQRIFSAIDMYNETKMLTPC